MIVNNNAIDDLFQWTRFLVFFSIKVTRNEFRIIKYISRSISTKRSTGKQEFCRKDFGTRLLAAEGEEGEDRCG